jgi:uncharacterized SAM-binding protein YcdF (DUF218 family)
MTFIITKTIQSLLVPPASLLIIMAAGFLIIRSCPRFGKLLIAAGLILLYLLSISPVSDALLKPLETSVPPLKDERVRADAIVVLGGGVRDLSWLGQRTGPACASLARLAKGIALYRASHIPLVLMGGNGDTSRSATSDAEAMKNTALALGVPAKSVMTENKSRNTIESARALRQVIKGKHIVLVTSAYHMKRAAAMFKKNGFDVTPASTDYMSEQTSFSLYSSIPRSGNLAASSVACTEYLSLFWYGRMHQI